jgi:hypothetical protein
MLKKGDKYIHFTKYGGVNFGTVKEVFNLHSFDHLNKVTYLKPCIRNENSMTYELEKDGRFYKIDREYTQEEADNLHNHFIRLVGMTKHQRISESLKGVKLPHEKADL